jgi:predicted Zn-dependent protease
VNNTQKEYLQTLAYVYIQHGRFEDGLTMLLLLKHLFPKDPHILLMRAFAYIQLQSPQAAREEVDAALPWIKTEKQRVSAYMMRAQALHALGLKAETRTEVERYLKLLSHVQPTLEEVTQ